MADQANACATEATVGRDVELTRDHSEDPRTAAVITDEQVLGWFASESQAWAWAIGRGTGEVWVRAENQPRHR